MKTTASDSKPTPSTRSGDGQAIKSPIVAVTENNVKPNSSAILNGSDMPAKPVQSMSNDELIGEMGSLFSLSVSIIARAGQLYAEINKRGIVFEIRSTLFRDLIPKVAAGELAPEAVSAFADAPGILQIVSKCGLETQRQLASDTTFPVVKRIGGAPVKMSVREMYPDHVRNVIIQGRILAADEQEKQLREKQGRRSSCGPTKAAPPDESEEERLAERINAELAKRGNVRLTARQFVELAIMFGWGPIK